MEASAYRTLSVLLMSAVYRSDLSSLKESTKKGGIVPIKTFKQCWERGAATKKALRQLRQNFF